MKYLLGFALLLSSVFASANPLGFPAGTAVTECDKYLLVWDRKAGSIEVTMKIYPLEGTWLFLKTPKDAVFRAVNLETGGHLQMFTTDERLFITRFAKETKVEKAFDLEQKPIESFSCPNKWNKV